MITREEAMLLLRKTLRDERRVLHSITVAEWMQSLAVPFGADRETWYLTGLLHDIDLPETIDNLSMHGILAKDKLEGLLPPDSIGAIMAHDPRTGLPARTEMAQALVFADVLENLRANIGMPEIEGCMRSHCWDGLRKRLPGKEYHIGVIESFVGQWPQRVGSALFPQP